MSESIKDEKPSPAPDTSGPSVSFDLSDKKSAPSPKSNPAPQPKAKKVEKKAAVPTPLPERVELRNTLFQVLSVEIRTAAGEFVSMEIPARSTKLWPKLDSYGADFDIKVKRGLIQIAPAK